MKLGMEPASGTTKKARRAQVRAWLFGVTQALGMALIARACALGSMALFSALPQAREGPWWSQVPGWLALVLLAKASARAGWWTTHGAWIFSILSVAVIFPLEFSQGPLAAFGWSTACLWACLWPKARRDALEEARIERAKAEKKAKEMDRDEEPPAV